MTVYTYDLKVFNPDGVSTGRLWCFQAQNDDEAKRKATIYLFERDVPPERKVELRRDGRGALIDWPR